MEADKLSLQTKFLRAIFLTAILVMLLPSAFASFTDEWGEYQDDETTRGFVNDVSSHFLDFGTTFSIGAGGNFQPLAVNMTGDGDLEVIIYSGNFIQLYDPELFLIDENNIGTGNDVQPVVYNNGSDNIAVSISADVLEAYSYNGTGFVDEFVNDSELNQTFSCNTWAGLRCEDDLCYALCDNTTHTFIIELDMINANFTVSAGLAPNIANGTPALADLDRDGNTEIAWVCDADGNGNYGVCVADLSTLAMETSFSADGVVDDIALSNRMGNPVFDNIDEGGDLEVILAYAEPTPGGLEIAAYNSDGSVSWNTEHALGITNAPVWVGNPMIMEFPSSRPDVCAFGKDNSATDVITFMCVEFDGTLIVNDSLVYGGVNQINQSWNTFAAPVIDGGICTDSSCDLDIVTTRFIMDRTGWSIPLNLTQLDNDYFIAYADVDDDGEGEIIATRAGTTQIIYSNFSNQPPVLNNSLTFGGYGNNLGYGVPICLDSTVTLSAQESGGILSSNYDNDNPSDTERIVSNCGQNADGTSSSSFTNNLANGTFAGANPTFQCVYNQTGAFSVRLFLQDDANDDDFTVFNTETIFFNVVNGTAGVTCNTGSPVSPGETETIVTGDQESLNNDAIDSTLGILFGTGSASDALKLIVGLALVMGIMVAAAREGLKSATAQIIIFFISLMIVTFIGLVTPAILLLGLAGGFLILFFTRFITAGQAAGGG